MNRRVGIVLATLVVAGILTTVQGTLSQPTPQAARKVIDLPGKTVQAPFSDAILTGNTLYLAGRIGLDPKTGKFNPIYKSYFTKEYPARAFIGAGSLLRGGHFELQAIAVKR